MLFIFILLFLFSFSPNTSKAQDASCSYHLCVPTLSVPSPTPTPTSCFTPEGSLDEFEAWRQEYYLGQMGQISRDDWRSDFGRNDGQPGCDGLVDLVDLEIWRQYYFDNL